MPAVPTRGVTDGHIGQYDCHDFTDIAQMSGKGPSGARETVSKPPPPCAVASAMGRVGAQKSNTSLANSHEHTPETIAVLNWHSVDECEIPRQPSV